mgnify:CR=1 FL=1
MVGEHRHHGHADLQLGGLDAHAIGDHHPDDRHRDVELPGLLQLGLEARGAGRGQVVGGHVAVQSQQDGGAGPLGVLGQLRGLDVHPGRTQQGADLAQRTRLVAVVEDQVDTLGAQFQLYSGYPYNPITGASCTTGYDCSSSATARYSPSYDSNQFTGRYPYSHRLDIRYTRKTAYKWGYFSWYIEVINIYNYTAANQQKWNYNQPYSDSNPKIGIADGALTLIPYFGLEWRF